MTTVTLKGHLTEDGELRVKLPHNFVSGEVEVTITVAEDEESAPDWTADELQALLIPEPKPGAEIAKSDAIGAWEHMEISDSVEWVAQLRRARRDNR